MSGKIWFGFLFFIISNLCWAQDWKDREAWLNKQELWHEELQNKTKRIELAKQLNIPKDYLEAIYQSNSPKWPTERSYWLSPVDENGVKQIGVSLNPKGCYLARDGDVGVPEDWLNEQISKFNSVFKKLSIPIELHAQDDLSQTGGIVMIQSKEVTRSCGDGAQACSGYYAINATSCEVYPKINWFKKITLPELKEHLLQHEGGHTFAGGHSDKINNLPKDPRIKAGASLGTVMNSQPTWQESYFLMPVGILTRQSPESEQGPLDELQSFLYYGTAANISDLPKYNILSPEASISKNAFFHAFLPELVSYFSYGIIAQLDMSQNKQAVLSKSLSFVSRVYLMEPWKGMMNAVLGLSPSHVLQELAVPISHLVDMHYFPIEKSVEFRYYIESLGFNWVFEFTGVLMGANLARLIAKTLPNKIKRESYFLNTKWQSGRYQMFKEAYSRRWDNSCLSRITCMKYLLVPIISADRALTSMILSVKKILGVQSLRWYGFLTQEAALEEGRGETPY